MVGPANTNTNNRPGLYRMGSHDVDAEVMRSFVCGKSCNAIRQRLKSEHFTKVVSVV